MDIRKITVIVSLIAAFLTLAAVGVVGASTNGSTYTVNSTKDEVDKTPGDNICSSTPSNVCTLRAAVMESNAHTGMDTVSLGQATYKLTISGRDAKTFNAAKGDLDITDDTKLYGFSMFATFIDAQKIDRVFDFADGVTVDMTSMDLKNGDSLEESGGALRSYAYQASLEFVKVEDSEGWGGGGIANLGSLMTLQRVIVNHNKVVLNPGGGLYNMGGLTMIESSIMNNDGHSGGGFTNGGTAMIVNSTFSGNKGTGDGGGIANFGAMDVSNITVTNNTSDYDSSGDGNGGGIFNLQNATFVVRNSIIAGNLDGQNDDDKDCMGNFTSGGYNLIGHNWLCAGFSNATHDLVGGVNNTIDPKLEPLAKIGYTYMHALKSGSPAIDKGNFAGCKDKYGVLIPLDQRLLARAVNGDGAGGLECDIGSYEYGSAKPTPTPTTIPPCSGKPAAPTLDTPANTAEVQQKNVPLNWDGKLCTTKYKVQVRMDAKKGPKADKKTLQTTEYTTKKLAKGHTYFWSVKGCNSDGCTKSATFTFEIK